MGHSIDLPEDLTEAQLDGRACIHCAAEDQPMRPVEAWSELSSQLFEWVDTLACADQVLTPAGLPMTVARELTRGLERFLVLVAFGVYLLWESRRVWSQPSVGASRRVAPLHQRAAALRTRRARQHTKDRIGSNGVVQVGQEDAARTDG